MSKTSSKGVGVGAGRGGAVTSVALPSSLASPNFALPFFIYITTPKETASTSPLITEFNLPIGFIQRLWVEYPRGCCGLVGVQIWRGVTQIFPLPEGVWMRSDDAKMNFAFSHDMTSEPYSVTIKTYNIDDTYQHTIWLGFEMRGKAEEMTSKLKGLLDYIGK